MVFRIETPQHAGHRDQARATVVALGPNLQGSHVVLDCAKLLVGTPSYLDEILKQVLVERGAEALEVRAASERARTLLERAAINRDVRDRLEFACDPPVQQAV